jgi:hypothetical protein
MLNIFISINQRACSPGWHLALTPIQLKGLVRLLIYIQWLAISVFALAIKKMSVVSRNAFATRLILPMPWRYRFGTPTPHFCHSDFAARSGATFSPGSSLIFKIINSSRPCKDFFYFFKNFPPKNTPWRYTDGEIFSVLQKAKPFGYARREQN